MSNVNEESGGINVNEESDGIAAVARHRMPGHGAAGVYQQVHTVLVQCTHSTPLDLTHASYQKPPAQSQVTRLHPDGHVSAAAFARGTIAPSSRSAAVVIKLMLVTSLRHISVAWLASRVRWSMSIGAKQREYKSPAQRPFGARVRSAAIGFPGKAPRASAGTWIILAKNGG